MDNGKVGPDNTPIEVWTCLKENEKAWLTKMFNKIMSSKKMSEESKSSTLIFIYKNNGTYKTM